MILLVRTRWKGQVLTPTPLVGRISRTDIKDEESEEDNLEKMVDVLFR